MASLAPALQDLELDTKPEAQLPYVYQPLKHKGSIRLIRLAPSESVSAHLQCRLVHSHLAHYPDIHHECISYAWGPATLTATLDIEGRVKMITETLAEALRAFRKTDKPRILWADAVCIDQDNATEKGSQVGMMNEIYAYADCVLVWLGPPDDRTAHVYDLLTHLCAVSAEYGIKQERITFGDWLVNETWDEAAPILPEHKKKLDSIASDYDFHGMDGFYGRSWFTRKWIIQEIAFARGQGIQLHCGPYSISWDDFITAARVQYRSVMRATLKNHRLPINFQYTKEIETTRARLHCQQQYCLLRNFKQLKTSNCSNDLDHVYAILNMRGTKDIEMRPDYTLSVSEAYIKLAQTMLEGGLHVSVFSYAGIAHRLAGPFASNENIVPNETASTNDICKVLPSWVPDWRIRHENRAFAEGNFAAARDGPDKIIVDPSGRSIQVNAMIIDMMIAGRTLGSQATLNLEQFRQAVLTIRRFYDLNQFRIKYGGNEDAETIFARTIVADLRESATQIWLRGTKLEPEMVDLWRQFSSVPVRSQPVSNIHPPIAAPNKTTGGAALYDLSDVIGYTLALRNILQGRLFFVTKEGRVGLAPVNTHTGDFIALFAGSDVPFIVRMAEGCTKDNLQCYVIGDCFVHGVMYGEFAKKMGKEVYDGAWKPLTLV